MNSPTNLIWQEVFWRRYFGAVARAKAAARSNECPCDSDGLVHVPPDPQPSSASPTPLTQLQETPSEFACLSHMNKQFAQRTGNCNRISWRHLGAFVVLQTLRRRATRVGCSRELLWLRILRRMLRLRTLTALRLASGWATSSLVRCSHAMQTSLRLTLVAQRTIVPWSCLWCGDTRAASKSLMPRLHAPLSELCAQLV